MPFPTSSTTGVSGGGRGPLQQQLYGAPEGLGHAAAGFVTHQHDEEEEDQKREGSCSGFSVGRPDVLKIGVRDSGEHVLHVICDIPHADLMAETRAWGDRILEMSFNTSEAQEGARAGLLAVSQGGVVVASDIIGGSKLGGNETVRQARISHSPIRVCQRQRHSKS